MLHRRTIKDDGRGVGEALNETENNGVGLRQIFRHNLIFGDNNRAVQKWNDQRIVITWANTNTNNFARKVINKAVFPVPDNVKLFLRPFGDDTYLLRLHNFDITKNVKYNIY